MSNPQGTATGAGIAAGLGVDPGLGASVGNAVGSAVGGVQSVAQTGSYANNFFRLMTNGPFLALATQRAALMIGGVIGVVLGFSILTLSSNTGRAAVGTAVKAGAAVATDGASVAATGAAKAAGKVA